MIIASLFSNGNEHVYDSKEVVILICMYYILYSCQDVVNYSPSVNIVYASNSLYSIIPVRFIIKTLLMISIQPILPIASGVPTFLKNTTLCPGPNIL